MKPRELPKEARELVACTADGSVWVDLSCPGARLLVRGTEIRYWPEPTLDEVNKELAIWRAKMVSFANDILAAAFVETLEP